MRRTPLICQVEPSNRSRPTHRTPSRRRRHEVTRGGVQRVRVFHVTLGMPVRDPAQCAVTARPAGRTLHAAPAATLPDRVPVLAPPGGSDSLASTYALEPGLLHDRATRFRLAGRSWSGSSACIRGAPYEPSLSSWISWIFLSNTVLAWLLRAQAFAAQALVQVGLRRPFSGSCSATVRLLASSSGLRPARTGSASAA